MINKLTILLPLALTILGLCQFLLSNDLASTGNSVYDIDQRIHTLRDENEILSSQVAVSRSLVVISKKAEELGLLVSGDYVTMPLYDAVAYR